MQQLKNILYSAILLAVVVVAIAPRNTLAIKCEGKSHNATFGVRRAGDKLLFKDHVVESWKLLRFAHKSIVYPPSNDKRKYIITFIKLTDRYTNGHGGCPIIKEGGIGKDNVNIYIKSQFTRGLDFDVEIYGMKKSKARKLQF